MLHKINADTISAIFEDDDPLARVAAFIAILTFIAEACGKQFSIVTDENDENAEWYIGDTAAIEALSECSEAEQLRLRRLEITDDTLD